MSDDWVDEAVGELEESRILLAFERAEREFGWGDANGRESRAEAGLYDDPKFQEEFALQLKVMVVEDTDATLLKKGVIAVDGLNADGTVRYAAGPNYPRGV